MLRRAAQDAGELAAALKDRCPSKIDIGPVYSVDPRQRAKYARDFRPVQRELVLDVDLTDAFGDDAPQPVKPPSPARAKGKPRAASPPADVVEDAAISNLIEFDADSISPSASWPKDK